MSPVNKQRLHATLTHQTEAPWKSLYSVSGNLTSVRVRPRATHSDACFLSSFAQRFSWAPVVGGQENARILHSSLVLCRCFKWESNTGKKCVCQKANLTLGVYQQRTKGFQNPFRIRHVDSSHQKSHYYLSLNKETTSYVVYLVKLNTCLHRALYKFRNILFFLTIQ